PAWLRPAACTVAPASGCARRDRARPARRRLASVARTGRAARSCRYRRARAAGAGATRWRAGAAARRDGTQRMAAAAVDRQVAPAAQSGGRWQGSAWQRFSLFVVVEPPADGTPITAHDHPLTLMARDSRERGRHKKAGDALGATGLFRRQSGQRTPALRSAAGVKSLAEAWVPY